MIIKQITAKETVGLRHQNLRQGQGIEACSWESDAHPEAVHFGLFVDDILTGIISVGPESNEKIVGVNQWRFRGLAVDKNHRNRGAAFSLVQAAIDYAKEKKANILWSTVRPAALKICENIGAEQVGDVYEIPGIGLHHLMTISMA